MAIQKAILKSNQCPFVSIPLVMAYLHPIGRLTLVVAIVCFTVFA